MISNTPIEATTAKLNTAVTNSPYLDGRNELLLGIDSIRVESTGNFTETEGNDERPEEGTTNDRACWVCGFVAISRRANLWRACKEK